MGEPKDGQVTVEFRDDLTRKATVDAVIRRRKHHENALKRAGDMDEDREFHEIREQRLTAALRDLGYEGDTRP